MKKWMDLATTILLNILVLASFVLTGMLWNNQPKLEMISPATYVESKRVGPSKQLEELVQPESIVFHYGGDRHTLARLGDGPYRMITSEMAKWYFYEFTLYALTNEKWNSLTRDKLGMEIRYPSGIPLPIFNQLFTFHGEMDYPLKGVDRLWLYYEEQDDVVYTLFISSEDRTVIRARTVVNPKDLRDSYLAIGKQLPEQMVQATEVKEGFNSDQSDPFWHHFYVPKERLTLRQYRYSYLTLEERLLIEAFFLDPTLVRKVVERDKTVIYSDGSRSVQLHPQQQFLTYTDPALPEQETDVAIEDELRSAISFVNQHLGWTDTYYFENMEMHPWEGDVMTFRPYIGSYPLIGETDMDAEKIAVTSQDGQIVSMKRPLRDYDIYLDYQQVAVLSGPELFQHLRDNGVELGQVSDAELGYQVKVLPEYAELIPVWVLEKTNGDYLVYEANALKYGGGERNGLE